MYSSFNDETMRLYEVAPMTAATKLALRLTGGFAAGWLGLAAGRPLSGR